MASMALPPRPSSICPSCWNGPFAAQLGLLGKPLVGLTGGYEYTISPAKLLLRAEFGCTWCMFLVKCIREMNGAVDLKKSGDTLCIRVGRKGHSQILTVSVNNVETNKSGYIVSTTPDDPAAKYISRRTRLTDVASLHTMSMIKACIERCAREHQSCQVSSSRPTGYNQAVHPLHVSSDVLTSEQKLRSVHPSDGNRVPAAPPGTLKRLLARASDHRGNMTTYRSPQSSARPAPTRLINCRDLDRLHLIMTKGSSYTYVALSYVWGPEDQPHRTTDANLPSYMCSIDSTKLPQTIRDAIYITRHLGIDFLWVDSLCIVQDSAGDKHRELALMRDVYSRAYLTIDAASAEKASDGFLSDRTPLRPDLVLPFVCPASYFDPLVKCGRLQLYENENLSLDIRTTNDGNLHTGERAWCLQETLLSTRTLVFSPHTVQLRCQTQTQNIGGAEHDNTYDIPRLPIALFYPDRPTSRYSEQWIQVRERWLEVVNHYTRRKLSYPSDKLVACAGLAELFARALRSDYVAGLWNDDYLLGDLLWLVPKPARLDPGTEYVAPSWSWASVEHATPFYVGLHLNPRAMATLVTCACIPQDLAFPLGPVASGYLVLQAHMFRCRVEGSEVSLVSDVFDDSSVRVDSYFDNERDAGDERLWAVPLQITDGDSDREPSSECWGILLHLSSPAAAGGVLRAEYHGLKVLRRVGCFVFDGKKKARVLGWDNDWLCGTATSNVIIV